MAQLGAPVARPVFLQGLAGRIFGVYFAAEAASRHRIAYLYLPPFAEEMNRSRRTAALHARALAALGIPVLVLDPYGTGDSEGDFRDARWEIWLDDVAVAAEWLRREAQCSAVGLWGLRLGTLLAVNAAVGLPDYFRRLLLWQPVLDGRSMLTQFLRIRVAAKLQDSGPRETTNGLRALLAAAGSIEVAGYELGAELGRALDDLKMESFALPVGARVDWLEITATAGESPSPSAMRIVEQWRARDVSVTTAYVSGEQFWSVEEAAPATTLIEASARLVAR